MLLPQDRAAGESEQVLNLPVISGLETAGDSLWLGMEVREPALMESLAMRVRVMVVEFNAQGLANTLWAFAKIEVRELAPMESLAMRVR